MTCKTPEAIQRSLARARAWKANNRERVRAYRSEYFKRNRDAETRNRAEWIARNPDAKRRYAKAHAASVRDWQATRKSERTGLVAMFKPAQVRSDYGNVCWACGDTKRVGIDHIIPLGRGGSNFAFNVRLLCFRCNARKRDRLDHEMKDPEFRTRLLLGHEAFTAINGDSL